MKRLSQILGILVLLSMILAACAGQPATTAPTEAPGAAETAAPAAQEPLTLTVWYWGEQEAPGMKDFMENAVQIYMKENPNITVNAVLQEIRLALSGLPRRCGSQRRPRHPVLLGRYLHPGRCLVGQSGPDQRLLERRKS